MSEVRELSKPSRGLGADFVRVARENWRTWLPTVGLVLAIAVLFWPLIRHLETLWFGEDTYYAHGAIVPLCSLFLVWERWDRLRIMPVRGSSLALIPMAAILYVTWFAGRTDMRTFQSGLLLALIALCVAFVVGWKFLKPLAIPIAYLGFGLPMFDRLVDTYTQPLQRLSTDASFKMLAMGGQNPYRVDPTIIGLGNFTLDVGVPCSGVKLLLAVMSIAVFFALIARLKWWGNAILIGSIVPITLVVNSLRITLIGLVGNSSGRAAGMQFHDTSGYLGLVVCFALLYGLTRALGWK